MLICITPVSQAFASCVVSFCPMSHNFFVWKNEDLMPKWNGTRGQAEKTLQLQWWHHNWITHVKHEVCSQDQLEWQSLKVVDANHLALPMYPIWRGEWRGGSILQVFLLRTLSALPSHCLNVMFCHLEINLLPYHCSPLSCLSFISFPWFSQVWCQSGLGPQPILRTLLSSQQAVYVVHLPPFRAWLLSTFCDCKVFPYFKFPPLQIIRSAGKLRAFLNLPEYEC